MIKNFSNNVFNPLLMKTKISIITGASGEIGQNLISYFTKSSRKKIIALDLNKSNYNNIFKFIEGSILDKDILNKINDEYIVEEIFHLAAILSTKAEKNQQLAKNVNVQGTINLLDLASSQYLTNKITTKFFFPSSIAVYNINKNTKNNKKSINEINYCNPKTVYGQHKLLCENLGTARHNQNNKQKSKIDFRCIRFPGIISANSIPTGGTSDYAPEMIHHAFQQKNYTCFVDSKSCLPFIVMPDAINAIIKIMNTDKNKLNKTVYNITSFSPEVIDLFNIIKSKFPKFKLNYNIDKMRQTIVNGWPSYIDDSAAKNDWGWKPQYNLKSAFDNYITPNLEKI